MSKYCLMNCIHYQNNEVGPEYHPTIEFRHAPKTILVMRMGAR